MDVVCAVVLDLPFLAKIQPSSEDAVAIRNLLKTRVVSESVHDIANRDRHTLALGHAQGHALRAVDSQSQL